MKSKHIIYHFIDNLILRSIQVNPEKHEVIMAYTNGTEKSLPVDMGMQKRFQEWIIGRILGREFIESMRKNYPDYILGDFLYPDDGRDMDIYTSPEYNTEVQKKIAQTIAGLEYNQTKQKYYTDRLFLASLHIIAGSYSTASNMYEALASDIEQITSSSVKKELEQHLQAAYNHLYGNCTAFKEEILPEHFSTSTKRRNQSQEFDIEVALLQEIQNMVGDEYTVQAVFAPPVKRSNAELLASTQAGLFNQIRPSQKKSLCTCEELSRHRTPIKPEYHKVFGDARLYFHEETAGEKKGEITLFIYHSKQDGCLKKFPISAQERKALENCRLQEDFLKILSGSPEGKAAAESIKLLSLESSFFHMMG